MLIICFFKKSNGERIQANATPEQSTTKIASQAQNNSSTGKDIK